MFVFRLQPSHVTMSDTEDVTLPSPYSEHVVTSHQRRETPQAMHPSGDVRTVTRPPDADDVTISDVRTRRHDALAAVPAELMQPPQEDVTIPKEEMEASIARTLSQQHSLEGSKLQRILGLACSSA